MVALVFSNLTVDPNCIGVSITRAPSTLMLALVISTPEPTSVALTLIVGVRSVVPVSGITSDSTGASVSLLIV